VNRAQRRGLVNGGIAAAVTFLIGSAFILATGDGGEQDGRSPAPPLRTSPSPTPECDPSWEVAPSADLEEAPTTLLDVTAVTPFEGWAVGGVGDPAAPTAVAVQRWDGTQWTSVEAPSPGFSLNELRAVDASEPNDVWAVGRTSSGAGERPLVLRYDATAWTQVEVPDEISGVLNSVAAISPNDVWAVGYVGDPAASLEQALVLHWDGVAWAVVDVHRAVGGGKSLLRDIDAVSPTDLWVVGYHHFRPLILRFDGAEWSQSPTEVKGTLNAIQAFATTEAWAVGQPIQRFDGSQWTAVADVPEDVDLRGVAAVGGQDIWAVGSRPARVAATTRATVWRYDGVRWRPVDGPPVPGSDELAAVDALPDGTILSVGNTDTRAGLRTLAVRGSTCPPLA
jgi:hypothetical protein